MLSFDKAPPRPRSLDTRNPVPSRPFGPGPSNGQRSPAAASVLHQRPSGATPHDRVITHTRRNSFSLRERSRNNSRSHKLRPNTHWSHLLHGATWFSIARDPSTGGRSSSRICWTPISKLL